MDNAPTLHFRYDEREGRSRIVFGNGDTEELFLTPVGDNLYRLEESSLVGEAMYRDVIRAERLDDGSLLFKRVETPSGLTMQSWLLSEQVIATPGLQAILQRVMALGGNWEQAFGGLLLIHTPQSYADEIFGCIQACNGTRS